MTKDFGMLGAKYEMGDFKLYKPMSHIVARSDSEIILSVTKTALSLSIKATREISEPSAVKIYFDDSNRMMMFPAVAGDADTFSVTMNDKRNCTRIKHTLLREEIMRRLDKDPKTFEGIIRIHGQKALSQNALLFNLNEIEIEAGGKK